MRTTRKDTKPAITDPDVDDGRGELCFNPHLEGTLKPCPFPVHRLALFLTVLFLAIPTFADTEWINSSSFTPSGSPGNANGIGSNGRLGERMSTGGTQITLTELGVYVVSGSTHTHTIEIKKLGDCGNTVATVSLNFNGLSGGVHYVALGSPVVLDFNENYYAYVTAVDGEDSFYVVQSISPTADMTCSDAAYATDGTSCNNVGSGANTASGPVFVKYTTSGGGGGAGNVGDLFRLSNEFMSGLTLPVSFGWTNSDTINAVILYTNNSGTFIPFRSYNATATNSDRIDVPQNQEWSFKVGLVGGDTNSNQVDIWGWQKDHNFSINPISTNSALFTFSSAASSNAPGQMIEQGTNGSFTGNVRWISVPQTNGILYTFTDSFAYLFNQRYWFRVYATNADGFFTGPSDIISAAPNAVPDPPNLFNAYNPGVTIVWTDLKRSFIQEWTIQASLSNTNSYVDLYSTPAGSPEYDITDASHSPGDVVFYRCRATNAVGSTFSPTIRVVIPQNVGGIVRYIDGLATGNETGTNWANAYSAFRNINWANTDPGTIFWIAPGCNYDENVVVGASGNNNAPIVFKLATTNAPRSGIARLISIINQSHPWVQWDGAKVDYEDRYLNARYPVTRLDGATNNCGIVLFGNTNTASAVVNIATGYKAKWFEISGPYVNQSEQGEGSVNAFKIAGGTGGDCEMSWNWIHDMTNDNRSGAEAFNPNPDSSTGFSGVIIHHNFMERVRDNFIGGGGHIDIHDNVLRDSSGGQIVAGHPDGIQIGCEYIRIWNNIAQNHNGTFAYMEGVATNNAYQLIYNNLVYGTTDPVNKPHDGVTFSTEHNQKNLDGTDKIFATMTYSNAVDAHNTFYGFDGGYFASTLRQNQVSVLLHTNFNILNNISVAHNIAEPFSFGYAINDTNGSATGRQGTNYTTAQVKLDYNIMCGADLRTAWGGTNYTLAQFAALTGFSSNANTAVQFVDTNTFDFHLTLADSTNMPSATNLSSLVSLCPGIDRTAEGYLRDKVGWKAGALGVAVDYRLICWPTFETYSRVSDVPDATPWLNDATLPGTIATNWPTSTNCPGNFAGAFFSDFQYLAITNCNELLNLTNVTLCFRGGIGSGPINDACWFDFGSLNGVTNGGAWGRDNSFGARFWINRDDGIQTNVCALPDVAGTPTGFHFWVQTLSFTGSSLTGVAYVDGVPYVTNTIDHCSRLTVAEAFKWIAIGKRKHNHSPDPDVSPDTPNGFIRSPMADIRIYKATLTADEVMSVYLGQGTGGGGGGGLPVVLMFAAPTTILLGGTSVLSVASSGAVTVNIDNGVGVAPLNGTTNVTPSVTTTYTATASNANGDSTAQATVTVSEPGPTLPGARFFKVRHK